mgnify:FL=1
MKILAIFLSVLLGFSASIQATPVAGQESVQLVSIQELRNQISEQEAVRSQNILEVQKLLRHKVVQAHVGRIFDLEKLAVSVPTLDDSTLERLAHESERMNEQFQAAGPSAMTYVVLGGMAIFIYFILIHTYDRYEP